MKQVTVGPNDANQRLDRFIGKYCRTMPMAMVYKMLRKKRVKCNGRRVTAPDLRLSEGDVLELYFNDEFFVSLPRPDGWKTAKAHLDVVYEDAHILLVNKRPGLVVHDDDSGTADTLIARIQAYLYQKGEYRPNAEQTFAPALCHRIDRNTGGMVLAAKTAEALRILNDAVKNREIKKWYLLLVQGHLPQKSGTLTHYLQKDEGQKRVFVYDSPRPGALTAVTRYRVAEERERESLVEAELVTGRTHQIRAQFAHIGHPLSGDGKYGSNAFNRAVGRKYQALYAYKLQFAFTKEHALSYLNGRVFTIDVPFAKGMDIKQEELQ